MSKKEDTNPFKRVLRWNYASIENTLAMWITLLSLGYCLGYLVGSWL
jgi:hypothetical protein